MDRKSIESALAAILEDLAAIEHDRWSRWQSHLHGKGVRQPDGSLLLPADEVKRWERQIATTYADLNEDEKESDRDQVREYLPLLTDTIFKL